ncbi:MAG: hypothetical protein ACPGN3_09425 [Opitutales bacterium]
MKLPRAFLLLPFFFHLLWSQEIVDVSISSVSLDSNKGNIKYDSDGEVRSLRIFRGQRSSNFRYVGPLPIQFFREEETTNAQGVTEIVRVPIATAHLPGKSGEFLLVWSKDRDNAGTYLTYAIQENLSDFPAGAFRFLNMAPFDVAVKIEDSVNRLAARAHTDIVLQASAGKNRRATMISLPKDDDSLVVFDGYIKHMPNIRMLYLIVPQTTGRSGQVKFISIPQSTRRS